MTTRDDELDDIEKELSEDRFKEQVSQATGGLPFLHRPAEMDIKPGMLCWMDGTRVCGPDCVAYNVEEVDPNSQELIQGPNKCLVLRYMGQQGAAALSVLLVNRKRIAEIQDKQRQDAQQQTPPDPFGGTR